MLLYGSDKKRKNAVQTDSNINGFFWLSGNAQGQGHLTRLWCFDQALPPHLFSYGYWLCPRADFPPNSRMRVISSRLYIPACPGELLFSQPGENNPGISIGPATSKYSSLKEQLWGIPPWSSG